MEMQAERREVGAFSFLLSLPFLITPLSKTIKYPLVITFHGVKMPEASARPERCPLSKRIVPDEAICSSCPLRAEDGAREAVLKCLNHLAESELSGVTEWVLSGPLSAVRPVLREVNTAIDHGDVGLKGLRESFSAPALEIVDSLDTAVLHGHHGNLMLAGDILFLTANYEQALEFYREYTKKMPDDPIGWNNCGLSASRLGDDETAVEFYKRAVILDRNYTTSWFNLAKALSRMKDYPRASKAFEKVVALDPNNISAWNNLGVMYNRQKRYREALRCYNRAVNIREDYVWAWCNKGIALAALGFPRRARRAFIRALEIDPDFKEAEDALNALSSS